MVTTERLFTMSSFEGLRLIRRNLHEAPHLSLDQIVAAIELTEPDAPALDLEASCMLHTIVEVCDLDGHHFYRHCIRGVVLARFPIWPAYCAARSGRDVPEADQARSKSCCVVAVGSRGMAQRADRIARRERSRQHFLLKGPFGDRVAPGPHLFVEIEPEHGDTLGDTHGDTVSPFRTGTESGIAKRNQHFVIPRVVGCSSDILLRTEPNPHPPAQSP